MPQRKPARPVRAVQVLARELTLLAVMIGDPRRYLICKLALGVGVAYLFVPIDLIPDQIPIVGHFDEAAFLTGGFAIARLFAEPASSSAGGGQLRRIRLRVFRLIGYRAWWTAHATVARRRSPARGIVVVGGAARSGTTMLRAALGRHRLITSGPETTVYLRRITAPRHLGPRLHRDACQIERWQFESLSQVEFVERFHRALLRDTGRPIWVEKTPANVFRFGFVRRNFPNARLVHIVRDGRDTVCSLRRQPWAKIDQRIARDSAEAARLCGEMWAASVKAGLRHRGDPLYHELRYEDLVGDPAQTLSRLLAFLDLPWDGNVLRTGPEPRADVPPPRGPGLGAYSDDCRDAVQTTLELNSAIAGRTIFSDSVGRWRTELSAADRAALAPVIGGLLLRLGYAHDNLWAELPTGPRYAGASASPSLPTR